MRKVEEMQEYQDVQDLLQRITKLSKEAEVEMIRNIVSQLCWSGPITREWLLKEVESQEQTEIRKPKLIVDHPIEDHFGSEIMGGDKYFEDRAGRRVLEDNWEDYLIEIGCVEFFRAIK